MTELVGAHSGEILVRLLRLNPLSTGIYGCEVQTKDSVNTYGLTPRKEMIVRDSTHSTNIALKASEFSAAAVIMCSSISLLHTVRVNYI